MTAPFTLDLRADIRAVERNLSIVQRKVIPRAIAEALNKTNQGIRTDAVRAVASATGITPQRRVRARLFIPRLGRATKNRLVAVGLVLFRYVPEIYLHNTKRAQKAQQGSNRFIATMPNGKTGIFRRKGDDRLPIKEFLVDLTSRAAPIVARVIARAGRVRWPKEFDRALRRQLRRR